jgi:hypothetical protein
MRILINVTTHGKSLINSFVCVHFDDTVLIKLSTSYPHPRTGGNQLTNKKINTKSQLKVSDNHTESKDHGWYGGILTVRDMYRLVYLYLSIVLT